MGSGESATWRFEVRGQAHIATCHPATAPGEPPSVSLDGALIAVVWRTEPEAASARMLMGHFDVEGVEAVVRVRLRELSRLERVLRYLPRVLVAVAGGLQAPIPTRPDDPVSLEVDGQLIDPALEEASVATV
jgi:hypothetical protein